MPSSSPETVPVALNVAYALAPRRVLDVGTGYGKYGVLFREYLELRHCIENATADDAALRPRSVVIDGIEGFEPYVGPLHAIVYDTLFTQDITEFVQRDFAYDFIFMGDVLEHLDKTVATDIVLPKLVQHASMGVLISVPADVREQDAVFDNELERHRSQWRASDFHQLADHVHCGRVGSHLVAFLTRNRQCLERVRGGGAIRRTVRTVKRSLQELAGRNW